MPALAFTIRNDLNDLRDVAVATTEFLETNGASPDVVFAANLAIEEMVSNTIKYGYRDGLEHQIVMTEVLSIHSPTQHHALRPPVNATKPAVSAFTLSATFSMVSSTCTAKGITSSG